MQKKLTIILLLLIACSQFAWNGEKPGNDIAGMQVRKWVLKELQLLKEDIKNIQKAGNIATKKLNYQQARKHYKHAEFFIEYFSPLEAKLYINGPPVPKHDQDLGRKMLPPRGFQCIEKILYNGYNPEKPAALQNELKLLTGQINSLEQYYKSVEITDDALLDMCQLQLVRMAALNLNGYDATISQSNIQETLWALEGIGETVVWFKTYAQQNETINECYKKLQKEIAHGKTLLNKNKNYGSFNRLGFITQFINPANELFVNLHTLTGLPWNKNKRALQLANGFLFGRESFNLQFFSIYYDDTLHLQEQAEIGRMLFSDPVLSGNNKYSCASCHNPSKAFTDGLSKSLSIDGASPVIRNAPTLLNVIFQKAFFYDGRAYQLEQQAFDVIHNPLEMQSSLAEAAARLKKNDGYKILFARAFVNTQDSAITEYAIQKSLAEYEKTLVSFNSRFDKYLHGNVNSLNSREINGYNVFAGKALCGSCHFLPLFNGTVPPYFNDSEFEIIGTAENADNKKIDSDEGRSVITGIPDQRHAFKTPTLRNIALTAPYMHNGAYTKLEEVIEFYHHGGGRGFGFSVPNQTLPFDSLQISMKEKEDILLFLETLTDTAGYKK